METLRLSVSKEDAEAILRHPDIWKTIAEDGIDAWDAPDGPIYLCGYADVPIGCFILHAHSADTWECHVQVLPEYRHVYAVEFGKAVILWAFANTTAKRLIAQIPVIYPNVRDFAVLQGFTVEGKLTASYRKDGELIDEWLLGLNNGLH